MDEVLVTRSPNVVSIALNRPERLNAVNDGLYRALLSALRDADTDAGVRCVLITGSGRAFCVGADLKEHSQHSRSRAEETNYVELGQRVCAQIQLMTTPVVAQVRGYALGAGAEIAVSADFLVMAQDAQMGFPEVALGTFVGGGVTARLPRLIGLRRATDLLMLGERFTGLQAEQWGLAHAAPPSERLDEVTEQLVQQLACKAPLSLARMKTTLRHQESSAQALITEAEQLLAVMKTDDWAEGIAAFVEGRPPMFRGR